MNTQFEKDLREAIAGGCDAIREDLVCLYKKIIGGDDREYLDKKASTYADNLIDDAVKRVLSVIEEQEEE